MEGVFRVPLPQPLAEWTVAFAEGLFYDPPSMHSLRFIGIFLCLVAVFCLVPASPAMGQIRTLKAVSYAGKRYVALEDLARMYGLPLTATGKKTLTIRGQYVSLQFTTNGRQADLNGGKVWLHAPVTKVRGRWSVSDADAKYVIDPLVRPSAYLGAGQNAHSCSGSGPRRKRSRGDQPERCPGESAGVGYCP